MLIPLQSTCGCNSFTHPLIGHWWENDGRKVLWEVCMLIRRRVSPNAAMYLLGLPQDVLQQGTARPAVARQFKSRLFVDHAVSGKLSSLNQCEYNSVLQSDERLANVAQREDGAQIAGGSFLHCHGLYSVPGRHYCKGAFSRSHARRPTR